MKGLIKKKIFVVMSILAVLFVTACVDQNADLEKVSFDNVMWEQARVGVSFLRVKSTVDEALLKIKNMPDGLEFKFIKHDDYQDSVLTAFYKPNQDWDYKMEKINSDFGSLKWSLDNIKIDGSFNFSDAKYEVNWSLKPALLRERIIGPESSGAAYKIQKIDFTNVTVSVKIIKTNLTTSDNITMDITLPGNYADKYNDLKNILVSDWLSKPDKKLVLPNKTFLLEGLNSDDITFKTIKAVVKLGTGANISDKYVDLEIEIKAADGNFTAFGWFDCSLGDVIAVEDIQNEIIPADIQHYLDAGTVLVFDDPRLNVEVESTLGVPLKFVMKGLSNVDVNGNSYPLEKEYKWSLKAANAVDDPATDKYTIDKREIAIQNPGDKANFEKMFRSNLDTLHLDYLITTQPLPKSLATITSADTKLQFVSSTSKTTVHGLAILPMIFGKETKIVYEDIIEADLSGEDFDFDELDKVLENDNVKVAIYLAYENTLPIGMGAILKFLDENKNPIPADLYTVSVSNGTGGWNDVPSKEIKLDNQKNGDISNLNWKDAKNWKTVRIVLGDVKQAQAIRHLSIRAYSDEVTTEKEAFLEKQGIAIKLMAHLDIKNLTVQQIKDILGED